MNIRQLHLPTLICVWKFQQNLLGFLTPAFITSLVSVMNITWLGGLPQIPVSALTSAFTHCTAARSDTPAQCPPGASDCSTNTKGPSPCGLSLFLSSLASSQNFPLWITWLWPYPSWCCSSQQWVHPHWGTKHFQFLLRGIYIYIF